MTTTYADSINDIALKTFEVTCFMFPMDEWEMEDEDIVLPDGDVRSVVEFDGAAEGAMVINPSEPLLSAIAENMLGIDEVDDLEKEGALCEIANIVCGNTVPLFARDQNICVIRPPRIADPYENTDETFKDMSREDVKVYLDEGVVEITLYLK